MIKLKLIKHDYIRIIKSQSYKQMSGVERSMLDLESEVMRGPGSIPTGGNIFHWNFLFSRNKPSDANIGIIVNVVYL